jgi:hypothetical protein
MSSCRTTRRVIMRHAPSARGVGGLPVLGGAGLGSRRCFGRSGCAWQRPFSWVPPS